MGYLSNKEIGILKRQGYTSRQIRDAELQLEQRELMGGSESDYYGMEDRQPSGFGEEQYSGFATKPDESIIRYQLELNDILERAEHILRGDVPKFKGGNIIWTENPHPETNTLNDVGVQMVLKILSMYINRNTILSDYEPEEISVKVFNFGKELNNLFFMKYEIMGMDTEEKRKEYPMIVTEMVDIVHSAYNRAKHGGERRSMREMIQIQQRQDVPNNPYNQQIPNKERGWLNPMRYIKGKWK